MIAALAVGIVAALAGGAFASSGSAPSISSDQADYGPGSTVTLTGSGWQGDTSVALSVNDSVGNTWTWSDTVTPDANGDITDTLTLPSTFVATYSVTATGSPSGAVATTTFTDGAVQIQGASTTAGTFSFTVHVTGYSDTSCTTNPGPGVDKTFSTTISAVSNETGTKDGSAHNANSFLLHESGASSDGRTFTGWNSGGTSDICVAVPASGNVNETAHFGAPTSPLSVDAGGPYSGDEGSSIALDGASVNNGGTNPHYSWSIDTSGGDSGISCPISSSTSLTAASVTCNDDSNGGTFTVTLSYYDDTHGSAANPITDTATLTVDNVAPTVTLSAGNDYTVDESTSVDRTFDYTVTDPASNDSLSVSSVSCGTNGSVASDNSNALDASDNGTLSCIFPDGSNTSTISVQAQDDDGGTSTAATHSVTINNVKPTPMVDSLTGNSGTACIGGNTVTLGFSWTDPAGSYDTYSYSVAWGDGSTTPPSGTTTATSPVTGLQHTYAAGGPYTITVTVNDEDPGSGNSVSSDPFSFLYNVTGVLQPVNDTQAHQDPSIFKYGSTLPVKIEVTDCNATPVSGLSPQISIKKISGSTPPSGTDETISSTSGADTGTTMRWSDPIYIYNLATKSLSDSSATYQITITGPFTTVTTLFGTKPK